MWTGVPPGASYSENTPFNSDHQRVPSYTKYTNEAFGILRHVRAEWLFSKRQRFTEALRYFVSRKAGLNGVDEKVVFDAVIWLMEPDDIACAALAAEIGVEE